MAFTRGGQFLRGRLGGDTAGSAVIADVVDRRVIDHRPVVDVRDVNSSEIVHGPIVEERAAAPIPALEAGAEIAEAVINTAIEPDMRPPISRVEDIGPVDPPPPGRRQVDPNDRREYP